MLRCLDGDDDECKHAETKNTRMTVLVADN